MEVNPALIADNDSLAARQRLGIIGNAPALLGAIERAVKVAPIDLSVLVTGPSGSGKEFFPKIIHQYSPRKHAPYIAVNCGAIPEGTIDSELFGHEIGAFTGAVASRKGYFEEANGGTIFLDEVAELPLTTQARLLRVLESGEFLKVGSSTVKKTNVRIVAATNVDMLRAVREGRFREDLYYRLSTIQIAVPPLRERGDDILLLARKFAVDFADRYHTPRINLTPEASHRLLRYSWPGNVRQLKNVIEQLALFNAGGDITLEMLSPHLPDSFEAFAPVAASQAGAQGAYEREREMLFNWIFRLQRELDDLRASMARPQAEHPEAITPHVEVSDAPAGPCDMARPTSLVKFDPRPFTLIGDPVATRENTPVTEAAEPTEPATPPGNRRTSARNLTATINDSEREIIRESLERNMGRRRNVAAELNISERTLYRKIKEYDLE